MPTRGPPTRATRSLVPVQPTPELLVGVEPTTSSLPRTRSTTELQQRSYDQERVRRIELPQPAWKAGALPLSYTRRNVLESGQGPGKLEWAGRDSNPRRTKSARFTVWCNWPLCHLPVVSCYIYRSRPTSTRSTLRWRANGTALLSRSFLKPARARIRQRPEIGNRLRLFARRAGPRSTRFQVSENPTGASGGNRTHNHRFTKPGLYR